MAWLDRTWSRTWDRTWARTWARTWDRTFAKWDRTRARTGTELGPNFFRSHQWVGKHWPCATILAHGVICMWDQMWDRTFFGPACAVGCRCRGNGPQTKFGPTCGGLHPRDGPQQSSVPHRGWAMLSGLPPTSSPPPSTPLRGIRLGEAYLLRAVPPGEV